MLGAMNRFLARTALSGLLLATPAIAAARVDLMSTGGFLFDIAEATDFGSPGSMSNGTRDAYDTCYRLRVGGTEYDPTGPTAMSLAGRQLEFPMQAIAGLSVRRLVYVPLSGGNYARYIEVLENTGSTPVTTMVEVYGNLGSDSSTVITGTSSGDTIATSADLWFTSDDGDGGGDPPLAHVFSGDSPSVAPTSASLERDNLSVIWEVTVPAGSRVALLHFAVQEVDRATSMSEARRLIELPDDVIMGADDYLDDVVNFSASVPGAPRIRFTSPFSADEGAEIVIDVMVEDPEGDTFTYSWDLDDDGTFGEMAGAASFTVAAGMTDGPAAFRVGVEAMDDGGNTSQRYRTIRVQNVDPMITSTPPLNTSVGVDLNYQLEVSDPAGMLDPPTYSLLQGPSRMAVTAAGVVQWTPTESDVTLPGETVAIEVQVDDGDEGLGSQRWELSVSPNHRPTPPVPTFPIDRVAILDTMPRFVVQNSEDEDLDPLTYTFQLDSVDTFDSPDMQELTVDEMPGFTSVRFPGPFELDTLFYWRVKASDGMVDSEWRATSFWVVRDPLLVDAGVDSGVVPTADGGLSGSDAGTGGEGGGCAVSPTNVGSPSGGQRQNTHGVWALLGLFMWVVARRRRR